MVELHDEFKSSQGGKHKDFVEFGWLPLDKSNEVYDECTKPLCQFGWQLLIIRERNPKLHTCFNKVDNGLMYKIKNSPHIYIYRHMYAHSISGHTNHKVSLI